MLRMWRYKSVDCRSEGNANALNGVIMAEPIKASEFNGDLSEFLNGYKYQPNLTPKLDDLEGVKITPELVNEIVLWKVNRYVSLDADQLRSIDALATLKAGGARKSPVGARRASRCAWRRSCDGVNVSPVSQSVSVPDHRPSCVSGDLWPGLQNVSGDFTEEEDRGLLRLH